MYCFNNISIINFQDIHIVLFQRPYIALWKIKLLITHFKQLCLHNFNDVLYLKIRFFVIYMWFHLNNAASKKWFFNNTVLRLNLLYNVCICNVSCKYPCFCIKHNDHTIPLDKLRNVSWPSKLSNCTNTCITRWNMKPKQETLNKSQLLPIFLHPNIYVDLEQVSANINLATTPQDEWTLISFDFLISHIFHFC